MVATLLMTGGIGLGWLATQLDADETALDLAAAPDADAAPVDEAADAAKAVTQRADAVPLQVAADRTGALESELARLRWALADRRRNCREAEIEPAETEAEIPVTVALSGPHSAIHNPAPPAPDEPPSIAAAPPPPALTPERGPAPPAPPQQVAALAPPPPSAVPVPPAPPPVSFQRGQDLSVPEAAVQSGDVSFLEGCWVSSPFSNPVNGVASTKVYCFDSNGNGQMNFRGTDGVTCNAPIRARWEAGRRLVLEEPHDGNCSNFGPWYRESTQCAVGADGRAQCNSYEFHRRFNYGTRLTRS